MPQGENLSTAALVAGHRVLRAAIYTRVSRDRKGQSRSVKEQETEGRGVVTRESWSLRGVWSDNDRSASQYARKGRPDWERLLHVIEDGEIDVLVVWEPSRATRDRQVWAALAALCQEREVLINASGKTYDPNDPDDMFQLDLYFALAVRESGTTRKRVQRSMQAAALKGRPHAHVPYGYRRIYDVNTGALLSQIPREPQAGIVREIIARIAEAEAVGRIASDLNARGVTAPGDERWDGSNVRRAAGIIRRPLSSDETMLVLEIRAQLDAGRSSAEIAGELNADGVPVLVNVGWTMQSVKAVVRNPAYAGRRVHRGKEIKTERDGGGAAWLPLVDPTLFDQAQQVFDAPGRANSRPGAARHLLTGIALCDVCGLPVGYVSRKTSRFYGCKTRPTATVTGFHVGRVEYKVDAYVLTELYGRLSRPDATALFVARADHDEVERVQVAISDDETYLEDMYAQAANPGDGERLSPRALAALEAPVLARIAANRERLAGMQVSPLVQELIADSPEEVEARFAALAFEQQREAVRQVVEIRILPIGPGGNHLPIEETVALRWRTRPPEVADGNVSRTPM